MKKKQGELLLSFDLPNMAEALRLAQRFANACGQDITVTDDAGDDVAQVKPRSVLSLKPILNFSVQHGLERKSKR